MVVCSPDPPLPDILNAPQIETVWHRRLTLNHSVFKYGLAWTVYDWVASALVKGVPLALCEKVSSSEVFNTPNLSQALT